MSDPTDHGQEAGLRSLSASTPSHWALSTPLETVHYAPLEQLGITLKIKREDLLNSRLSGNKLYKLHGHLQAARQQGATRLISFGGYYSNHLHALAYLGRATGLQTLGIVRGHPPQNLSPTLQDCVKQGMELQFVSRKEYRELQDSGQTSPRQLQLRSQSQPQLQQQDSGAYVIPEGGGGAAGLSGCAAIMTALRAQTDLSNTTVCVACGTGTTFAGLLTGSQTSDRLLGFAALKLGDHLPDYKAGVGRQVEIGDIGAQWEIMDDSYFGGFGKTTAQLFTFMRHFEAATGILLDPVYTAKLLFNVVRLAEAGYWPAGHQVIVVHTGGLQGRRGYKELTDSTTAFT